MRLEGIRCFRFVTSACVGFWGKGERSAVVETVRSLATVGISVRGVLVPEKNAVRPLLFTHKAFRCFVGCRLRSLKFTFWNDSRLLPY